MKVLVVGSGGREHALVWALARSAERLYAAPGNAGTEELAENVPLPAHDLEGLVRFAWQQRVDLVVVGPEAPLAAGLADLCQQRGVAVFGPTREAARLEASKAFARRLMEEEGIPGPAYAVCRNRAEVRRALKRFPGGVAVKADGLAAGKGVTLCATSEEAEPIACRLLGGALGEAGTTVVLEERLEGREVSLLGFSDGRTLVPMPPARDHKRVFDGDRGPNTGGMGAYAPVPDLSPGEAEELADRLLRPVVAGMARRGIPYRGVLYAGCMLTEAGPRVLEYNCRFGDPEAQVLLPLLETDLLEVLQACAGGWLDRVAVRWKPGACAAVVLAAAGYPGSCPRGVPISGLEEGADVLVFHAGTRREGGRVVTAGGRVLAVSARGPQVEEACRRVYARIGRIHFEGAHYRRDIGAGAPVPQA